MDDLSTCGWLQMRWTVQFILRKWMIVIMIITLFQCLPIFNDLILGGCWSNTEAQHWSVGTNVRTMQTTHQSNRSTMKILSTVPTAQHYGINMCWVTSLFWCCVTMKSKCCKHFFWRIAAFCPRPVHSQLKDFDDVSERLDPCSSLGTPTSLTSRWVSYSSAVW